MVELAQQPSRSTIYFALAAVALPPFLLFAGSYAIRCSEMPLSVGRLLPTLGFVSGAIVAPVAVAQGAIALVVNRPVQVKAVVGVFGVVVSFGALVMAARLAMSARIESYRYVARDLAPLVGAIHGYQDEHGEPPPSLDAVNVALSGLPERYRSNIRYTRRGDAGSELFENDWGLSVDASWGFGFDSFVYFSKQKYPRHMHGGVPEPVGSWVYVHE